MDKIIVVTGPTAVGKTKLSISLAKKYNGEIINADAMQIYKGLNIGTAKIKEEEKEGAIHHLFDIKDVLENYSVYEYQKDCRKKIDEIRAKKKTPIIVGGTGLYIKSALYDYKFSENKDNFNYDDLSCEELYNILLSLDKNIDKIDTNNKRRMISAIKYYKENNCSITENVTNKLLYDAIFIGLTTDREVLYDKINKRVDEMLKEGLEDEVKYFYNLKIFSKPLISGIGYKELYEVFDKKQVKEDAIEKIKRNSRRYAKRQYTYFRNQLPIKWFETDYDNFTKTINEVFNYIDNL